MSDVVDTWARAVAQRLSRRQLLGGMGAITAGSALGVLSAAPAEGVVTPWGLATPPRMRTCPSGYVP